MSMSKRSSSKFVVPKSFCVFKENVLESHAYPFDNDNDLGLGRRFYEKLNQHRDKIHQVDAICGKAETKGSLLQRGIQVALEMQMRNIKDNSIVMICSKVHCEQTVVVLATLLIGAIVAPLDPECSLADFKSFVLTLKPALAFCDGRICGHLENIVRTTPELASCQIVTFGARAGLFQPFEKLLARKSNVDFEPVNVNDPKSKVAFVVSTQYTSGSARFVCISHHAVRVQMYYANIIFDGPEKILSFFPLSWVTQVIITCYCLQAQVVKIIPGEFSERSACRLIHDLRIDHALLGTNYALRIAHNSSVNDFNLSYLKAIYVGGFLTSAVDMVLLRCCFKGVAVYQCYGLTEMSCLVTGFPADNSLTVFKKPGSVGMPLPGVKLKVVDFETREVLGADLWGELLISGSTLMLGYFKDDGATVAAFEKRYFKTGDVAQYDSDGYVYIQGRGSNYIIVDNCRFLPTELEDALRVHSHVYEAMVVGNHREIVACVVKNPDCELTSDALMEYISDRLPERYWPNRIEFLESLPKTSIGKIKMNVLKKSVLDVTIEYSKSVVSMDGGGK